jgi:hypothetical protein
MHNIDCFKPKLEWLGQGFVDSPQCQDPRGSCRLLLTCMEVENHNWPIQYFLMQLIESVSLQSVPINIP